MPAFAKHNGFRMSTATFCAFDLVGETDCTPRFPIVLNTHEKPKVAIILGTLNREATGAHLSAKFR